MHARAVDAADSRLRELRQDEWTRFVLGGLALALSLVATVVRPELAVPLFVGGLVLGALGVRAVLEHSEIVDRLAGERDAFVIPEIRQRAARETTMERRHALADHVRSWLREPAPERVRAAAPELEALAAELDDDELTLDPVAAVGCVQLLTSPESPLLSTARPPDELRARVGQIRSGFAARALSA
jgi:hypothetical protein